jgi:DNA-binding FadR family transcriptional regulator
MGELGMGRTQLRRALEALEFEGAIWRHVGKGTFIANNSNSASLSDLSKRVSPVHMMRARLSLEPAIAREAAIQVSEDRLVPLRICIERSEGAANWVDYETQDDAFHRGIALATNNDLLLSLFDHLNSVRRAIAWNTVERSTERPPSDHNSFSQHRAILEAIEAHDAERAHAEMRVHLGSVERRLFGGI